jgi:hypothetical protein
MTIARAQLVDVSLARWYHCITRCVRRAFLLGEGDDNRKEWLENRLQELAGGLGPPPGILRFTQFLFDLVWITHSNIAYRYPLALRQIDECDRVPPSAGRSFVTLCTSRPPKAADGAGARLTLGSLPLLRTLP